MSRDSTKLQDSPPDFGHGLVDKPVASVDTILRHTFKVHGLPGTISIENGTKAKVEEQVIELPFVHPDSPIPSPERPRKEQQVIVLVPTLAEIRRKKGANDDDIAKLNKLFKPKKKTDLALDEKILISRLKPIGLDPFTVNLPRAELNQMVSRWFMSSTYGGSTQSTFPKIGAKKLAEHGMGDFMYLNLKYDPYAPQCPGGGGLWFRPEWYGDPQQAVYRVFTRDEYLPVWQYMGQYEVKATAPLTLTEWLGLEDIRYHWAKEICTQKWGNSLRARIQAREEVGPGREPSSEEVMAILRSGRWSNIAVEDVRIAFDCAKERMGLWTMKCIGYDYRFQLEIYDKFPNWTPPENSKRKQKSKRSKVKGEEYKIAMPDSEKGSEDGTEMDDEEQVLIKIRTRGTNSRPISIP